MNLLRYALNVTIALAVIHFTVVAYVVVVFSFTTPSEEILDAIPQASKWFVFYLFFFPFWIFVIARKLRHEPAINIRAILAILFLIFTLFAIVSVLNLSDAYLGQSLPAASFVHTSFGMATLYLLLLLLLLIKHVRKGYFPPHKIDKNVSSKIQQVTKEVARYSIYLSLLAFGLYSAASQDPDINWIIKFVGFFTWVYLWAKVVFPERFTNKGSSSFGDTHSGTGQRI